MIVSKQDASPATGRRLDTVQALRAIAAILIVVLHAQTTWPLPFPAIHWNKLGIGVDLFFVISGFVIVYASQPLFTAPKGWRTFLLRRLVRIVPLYWMALTLWLVVQSVAAVAGLKTLPSGTAVAASYLFIPYDSLGFGDAYPFPVLDLGWTLNYEMFFYLVVGACLFLPMGRAVATVGGLLLVGVLTAAVFPLALPFGFWLRPIVLEFAAGMLIALAYIRGMRIALRAGLLLGALGLAIVTATDLTRFASYGGPGFYSFARLSVFGSAAIFLIAAATLSRGAGLPRMFGWLTALGNSSYALYLLHPIVFAGFKALLLLHPVPASAHPYLLLIVIAAAVGAAHVFHLRVELPVTRWLRARIADKPRPELASA